MQIGISRAHLYLTVVTMLSVLPNTVKAQSDPPGGDNYLSLSDGAASCREYATAHDVNQAHMVEWVLGFISGLNAGSTGTRRFVGQGFQITAIPEWLTHYCTEHELASLTAAALALREDLVAHGIVGR